MNTVSIDDANISAVRDHIRRQFAQKSWWPKEGPLQAKEQFEAAQYNPESLARWCVQWLDGSQWRQLKIAVGKATQAT